MSVLFLHFQLHHYISKSPPTLPNNFKINIWNGEDEGEQRFTAYLIFEVKKGRWECFDVNVRFKSRSLMSQAWSPHKSHWTFQCFFFLSFLPLCRSEDRSGVTLSCNKCFKGRRPDIVLHTQDSCVCVHTGTDLLFVYCINSITHTLSCCPGRPENIDMYMLQKWRRS